MSQFNATGFSTIFCRLLTPLIAAAAASVADESNSLIVSRIEISPQDQWSVENIYPTPADWEVEFRTISGDEGDPSWSGLDTCRGKLSDPSVLKKYFDLYFSVDRSINKLEIYANLRSDVDLSDDAYRRRKEMASLLNQKFRFATAWMEPEILSLNEAQFNRLFEDPSLKPYHFTLEKMARMRPYTLSKSEEELLALSSQAVASSSKIYSVLTNTEMDFKPAVDAQGNQYPLSEGSYLRLVSSEDRALRKSSFIHLMEEYEHHIQSITEILQGKIQGFLFHAKARHFPDCVTASLYPNRIDPLVMRKLIETVRKGQALMSEYLALKKEALKIDAFHIYDFRAPLVSNLNQTFSYDQARDLVIESVAPLGESYQATLRKGLLEERWVDPYQNKFKRSGAYSCGCYDSHPFILMSFQGKMKDVVTLAHEAGHSMHSYLSRENQPYSTHNYTLFVAEVASMFNEQLLYDLLYKRAKTKEERVNLLCEQIERIRGTIFRQTLFAEFELKIHELAESGQPFTPSLLNQIYRDLLRDYYGPHLTIDSGAEAEWARLIHFFYYDFYVYQYATGLSAATALYERAIHSAEARDRYLRFLCSGGSQFPLDLLKEAGVDMTKSDPVEAVLNRFKNLVVELRENL